VKGGRYLEDAGRADVVLFDKTGTLTQGKPRVDTIVAVEGVEEKEVLEQAASVEQDSTHPLAQAVLKAASYAKITINRAEEIITEIGLGVRGLVQGRSVEVGSAYLRGGTVNVPEGLRLHLERFKEEGATPLVVYQDQRPLGILSVSDHVRPDAAEAVRNLKSLGITRIGMLSGDHEKSARLVADSVGLTQTWSGQKPEEKLAVIREFQRAGGVVIFVGDGINDAPALAAAHVGVAMGAAGTDVALETADIALMHDDISRLPFLIRLSRRMLKTIKWNIAFGMLFNAAAVLASGGGFLSPIMGAIVHNVGSVIVVVSSASIAFASERKPSSG
jgi:Cd2+/Zn2+-exporting ATPase